MGASKALVRGYHSYLSSFLGAAGRDGTAVRSVLLLLLLFFEGFEAAARRFCRMFVLRPAAHVMLQRLPAARDRKQTDKSCKGRPCMSLWQKAWPACLCLADAASAS